MSSLLLKIALKGLLGLGALALCAGAGFALSILLWGILFSYRMPELAHAVLVAGYWSVGLVACGCGRRVEQSAGVSWRRCTAPALPPVPEQADVRQLRCGNRRLVLDNDPSPPLWPHAESSALVAG